MKDELKSVCIIIRYSSNNYGIKIIEEGVSVITNE